MNIFEFMYLIGCGTSFFMALSEFAPQGEEDCSDVGFASLILIAILCASTSWGFVIYEKYFDNRGLK